MPNRDYIQSVAYDLIKKYDTRDPFEICKATGVEVFYADLGNLKGMYKYLKKNRFAVINEKLDSYTKKLVCAHELGHDIFHRDLAKRVCLQEFMLYDMKSRPEYEANLFASEILLPDDEIFTYAYGGYDIEQIAKALYTDINLVALKMASMNTRGYEFRTVIDPKSDFLRK
ncbi:putative Zn peptidase [Desulfitobacterium sp. LBE]|uniref:ImmA/IrrE family metallo-endopeptidase n=1 Tax=Desulfitobacterium sp. LBE TaxID=884086 RepID=UPI00119A7F9E|nr:ImmA/IrrE family metallo-endopeptidase [Desulfitobacterium sp. LBE]TWH59375.1 putative Zn peptidase [Desulfitobacterium sp. LBE]